ncbi:hypothetical protein GGTG_08715 [Gaeumannomyces tritici R3-111a-1]|uniref:Uncharacterized protein n=1 Tax=Gaeumannomyces tritici (strain R3-111a-1) TaxID=644352 RepID=J3P5C6_GAET3|nr:hypothetical protein GGTG_08715 [Gaeumannomyces tritici R3-111a-1]EJT74877.1 hypothetical protein GGTG_08715 [Gaeumannomyces tritici R3-111a-1]
MCTYRYIICHLCSSEMSEDIQRCAERPEGREPHPPTPGNSVDFPSEEECEDCELLNVGDPSTDESDDSHPGGSESGGSQDDGLEDDGFEGGGSESGDSESDGSESGGSEYDDSDSGGW